MKKPLGMLRDRVILRGGPLDGRVTEIQDQLDVLFFGDEIYNRTHDIDYDAHARVWIHTGNRCTTECANRPSPLNHSAK
jgi:hypothetical protein